MNLKIHLKSYTKIIRQIFRHIFLFEEDFPDAIDELIESIPDYKYSQSDNFTECLNNKRFSYSSQEEKENDILKTLSKFISN